MKTIRIFLHHMQLLNKGKRLIHQPQALKVNWNSHPRISLWACLELHNTESDDHDSSKHLTVNDNSTWMIFAHALKDDLMSSNKVSCLRSKQSKLFRSVPFVSCLAVKWPQPGHATTPAPFLSCQEVRIVTTSSLSGTSISYKDFQNPHSCLRVC